jgi:outer membrane protein assembly factor BamB
MESGKAFWKTAVPPGNSSPIVMGQRLYLTGVEEERLTTVALDTGTGEILWRRQAPQVPLEPVHNVNSAAASTPCADEHSVYVYFGSYGLLCYDVDGGVRWERPIPTPKSLYGMSTSPILHGEHLILVLDDDENLPDSQFSRSRVVALDKATGRIRWETPRPYHRSAWSTPMIWRHAEGTDLVVLGNGRVCGYQPETGEEQWHVTGFAREPIAVPVAGDGHLYVSVSMQGGRGDVTLDPEPFWVAMLYFDRDGDGRLGRDEITEAFTLPLRPELSPEHPGFGIPLPQDPVMRKERQLGLFDRRDKDRDGYWTKEEFIADMFAGHGRPYLRAIRPGGSGDVSETHVVWDLTRGIPEIPSPIFHDGRLYLVRDGGLLTCVRTDTGEVVYRERLGAAGQYMASPVIANGHLYLVSASGVISVVKTGDTFSIDHQTALELPVVATPAMDDRSLYVRAGPSVLAFR